MALLPDCDGRRASDMTPAGSTPYMPQRSISRGNTALRHSRKLIRETQLPAGLQVTPSDAGAEPMSILGLTPAVPKTVQNPYSFRTKPTTRPVNPPGYRQKYRRDTDVILMRYRPAFSLLTKGLPPIRPNLNAAPCGTASSRRFKHALPT